MTGWQLFHQSIPRTYIEGLIPDTLRAPPPISRSRQTISDDYLKRDADYEQITIEDRIRDLLMPLYLGEELSPRFAHWKENQAFHQRRSVFHQQKEMFRQKAVEEWKKGGKDKGLRAVMNTAEAGLSGVPLSPRTEKEVQQAADIEYDTDLQRDLRRKAWEIRAGRIWNYATEQWEDTEQSEAKQRKQKRKAAKKVQKLQYLDTLRLPEGKNQVLPPGLSRKNQQRSVEGTA